MHEILARKLRASLRQQNPSGKGMAYAVGAALLAGGIIYGVHRHRTKSKTPQIAPPLPPLLPPPVT